MRWIKLFCLSSVLFISAVIFGSQPTYATSQSFTYDSTNIPDSNQLVWQGSSGSLTDTPLISFTPVYVEVFVSNFPYYYSYNGSNSYGALSNGQYGGANLKLLIPFNSAIHYYLDVSNITNDSNMELWIRFGQYRSNIVNNPGSSITYIFYDSLPSNDCPDCPEVPETPYGDILDKIYHAILFVPAVALVLYFFYIMFGWYLGGRS